MGRVVFWSKRLKFHFSFRRLFIFAGIPSLVGYFGFQPLGFVFSGLG
jgi:hypothetical protein